MSLEWVYSFKPGYCIMNIGTSRGWNIVSPLQLLPLLNKENIYINATGNMCQKTFTYKNSIFSMQVSYRDPVSVNIDKDELEKFIINGILIYDRKQKL